MGWQYLYRADYRHPLNTDAQPWRNQSAATRRNGNRGATMYTLLEAAKATGRNKTTILRAIKSGKMSATRNDAGNYQIDAAELHRVYAPAPATDAQPDATPPEATERTTSEPDAMRGKALAYRTLAKQQQQRLAEQADTIADLRARLDRSEAERQRTGAQLAGLLTHQAKAEQGAKRRWWPW